MNKKVQFRCLNLWVSWNFEDRNGNNRVTADYFFSIFRVCPFSLTTRVLFDHFLRKIFLFWWLTQKSRLTVSEGKIYLRVDNFKTWFVQIINREMFNGAADEHQHTIFHSFIAKEANQLNNLIPSVATSHIWRKWMHVGYSEKNPLVRTKNLFSRRGLKCFTPKR